MLTMTDDMAKMMEEKGAMVRPPDVGALVGCAIKTAADGMAGACNHIADVGKMVQVAANEIRAAGVAQAAASRSGAEIMAAALARKGGFTFTVKRGGNGLIESVEARPL